MEIILHSFGTSESLDLRCILEGMYRKTGRVKDVSFPDANKVRILLDNFYGYENEYGIHRMIRVPPRAEELKPSSSHVMVEIEGKTRDTIVCTYTFFPQSLVENNVTGKKTRDIIHVLNGHPLEIEEQVPMFEFV